MKYVILSCDANPLYTKWIPISIRLWRNCGFEPVLFASHDLDISNKLCEFVNVPRVLMYAMGMPLFEYRSADLMRFVRLVAGVHDMFRDTDVLMTHDIDGPPLCPYWHEFLAHEAVLFRADAYQRIDDATSLELHPERFADWKGFWRFPMSSAMMTARRWRQLNIATMHSDWQGALMAHLHVVVTNGIDRASADEAALSILALGNEHKVARRELPRRGAGQMPQWDLRTDGGDFLLVGDPNRHMREANGCFRGWPAPDLHASRPCAPGTLEALCAAWPEEAAWLRSYAADLPAGALV